MVAVRARWLGTAGGERSVGGSGSQALFFLGGELRSNLVSEPQANDGDVSLKPLRTVDAVCAGRPSVLVVTLERCRRRRISACGVQTVLLERPERGYNVEVAFLPAAGGRLLAPRLRSSVHARPDGVAPHIRRFEQIDRVARSICALEDNVISPEYADPSGIDSDPSG